MMVGLSFLPARLGTGAGHWAGARTSFWGVGGSLSLGREGNRP
jgi:hypothetical protein